MPSYTVPELKEKGPSFAMAMLLDRLFSNEYFVTYGEIAKELEYQLDINRIFSTQIGHVAGAMMDMILEIDPNAPLINILITRPSGTPGIGAGSFLAKRYNKKYLRDWKSVCHEEKLSLVETEREKILKYPDWELIFDKLFESGLRTKIRRPEKEERDFSRQHGRAGGESKEHKKLKAWISENPNAIGLTSGYGHGKQEVPLFSGDVVDVLFSMGSKYRPVEVESLLSSDDDIRRGIYQCIKYQAVKAAELYPMRCDIKAILVVENELSPSNKRRAKDLGVKYKVVKING